jgi:hypothetical protein
LEVSFFICIFALLNYINIMGKPNNDVIDLENGSMIILKDNLNTYLKMYMCNTEDELKDSMWFNYGIIVKII